MPHRSLHTGRRRLRDFPRYLEHDTLQLGGALPVGALHRNAARIAPLNLAELALRPEVRVVVDQRRVVPELRDPAQRLIANRLLVEIDTRAGLVLPARVVSRLKAGLPGFKPLEQGAVEGRIAVNACGARAAALEEEEAVELSDFFLVGIARWPEEGHVGAGSHLRRHQEKAAVELLLLVKTGGRCLVQRARVQRRSRADAPRAFRLFDWRRRSRAGGQAPDGNHRPAAEPIHQGVSLTPCGARTRRSSRSRASPSRPGAGSACAACRRRPACRS